ncbi:MAG: hypothetical protein ACRD1X_20010 [Vicinamibacteria bacterium]
MKGGSAPLSVLAIVLAGVIRADSQERGKPSSFFHTSDRCMACHNGLVTETGEDVSIGTEWRASMMANSSRDPYWQAAVRRETMDHPKAKAAIEDMCSTCHMPMARFTARTQGREGEIFAHLPVTRAETEDERLAADGVSCAVCHGIQPEGLGTEESFTGGFVVDTASPWDSRPIFGPFEIDHGLAAIMRSATGFVPTQAPHVQSSELCATCHTLFTEALGPNGELLGRLPEQVPYLEWRHSGYRDEQTCQSCHMPLVATDTPIASVLGEPRAGFSRHVFRGGNFFMLKMLNRYRVELGVTAGPQELDTAASLTVEHLQSSSAVIRLSRADLAAGRLDVEVAVENLGGHKLPTAYPSRRAWLHVTVRDGGGRLVFESGRLDESGAIDGNDNDDDPSRYEPHYTAITRPDEVQIYEAIMVDSEGRVTTGLASGLRFVKDNRILPRGFDKGTADDDVAVRGRALEDPDFSGEGDRVRYAVDVSGARGPFHVEAELWYQPIAYRWARNLASYDSFETQRFVTYYESMSELSGVVLARSEANVPGAGRPN